MADDGAALHFVGWAAIEKMEFFGHVGLTLGAAYLGNRLVYRTPRASSLNTEPAQTDPQPVGGPSAEEEPSGTPLLDYRLVVVGSLVPDILDKPLGLWIAPGLVNHALQSIGHTFLFSALILAAFAVAYRLRSGRRLWVLGLSCLGHLVLDQMWRKPVTALWPFLGMTFPLGMATFPGWSQSHLLDLLTLYDDPPELIGFIVVVLFAARLTRPLAFRRFVRTGALV